MKAYSLDVDKVLVGLDSSVNGLSDNAVLLSQKKYGKNQITKVKPKTLFRRVSEALLEPMLIILEIAAAITLGVNIGKFIKTGNGDFYECIGIVLSILISVVLTLVMEGKSKKAFEMLGNLYDTAAVKVIRNGKIKIISQKDIVVGDVVAIEAGDKIYADGRLISSGGLEVDESMLTGESVAVKKYAGVTLSEKTPLAERKNMLYGGTFITAGSGNYVVTAVGDGAEIGVIASDLQVKDAVSQPLQEKLTRLSKLITALGIIAASFVLILSITRLFVENNVSFDSVQNAFLSSIVLIVASVPEGLPTTVAIALTLNVVKLSKSNALIKKLVAAETVGCVSVICSDKTGTLTENKMSVTNIVAYKGRGSYQNIINNSAINSTAEINVKGVNLGRVGSATECALLDCAEKSGVNYKKLRESIKILNRTPFSSEIKYMSTTVSGTVNGTYFKGAPEKIIEFCSLSNKERLEQLKTIKGYQAMGKRVIAFAYSSSGSEPKNLEYNGFAVISDPVRKDVYKSVEACKKAGIKVKILTGDNYETAYAIARELNLADTASQVVNAFDIEDMSDAELKNRLQDVTVVARSTPKTKLRIVTLLKDLGEVVAVTGDGVNDAPAIKHADIGICMGGGSEITKEASDIVLLDNSFSTIVTAISFGRNIYLNFQRFITFQLSVNLTAVAFIVTSLVLGLANPFNTVALLWINVIMDGPPALTLGLEAGNSEVMDRRPVKRSDNIVSVKMLLRIIIHATYMCALLIIQYKTDFLQVGEKQMKSVMLSTFILFQLFNAFNCRELGSVSVFKNLKGNKLMLMVFLGTFIIQVLLSELCCGFFDTVPLSVLTWLKMILTSSSIVMLSEIYKYFKRKFNKRQNLKGNSQIRLIKKKNNA